MTITAANLSSFASTLQRAPTTTANPTEIGATRTQGGSPTGGANFADHVQEVLEDVNAHQVRADNAAEAFASGERTDMHGTMIALEQADISLRLVSNVRSRLVEAYREVMRMGA